MSEQPPSVAARIGPMSASRTQPPGIVWPTLVLDLDDIGPLLTHIQHVTDEWPLVTGCKPHLGRRDLRLAHQEEIDIVRRQRVIERRLDHVARPRRPHDAW